MLDVSEVLWKQNKQKKKENQTNKVSGEKGRVRQNEEPS